MLPPTVAMKGHHASGGVTLAAMMIMKRAFKRFRTRRALMKLKLIATADAAAETAESQGGEGRGGASHTAIAVSAAGAPTA
jgi:hypothetical protein